MALLIVYSLILFGFILCFVSKFPGQVLAYVGMLVAEFGLHAKYPIQLIILCGVLVIASLIINKTIAPKLANKIYAFGKAGKKGTSLGSVVGLLCCSAAQKAPLLALMLFIGLPYAFAFVFETISVRGVAEGAKRAGGAYTLYAVTTLLNVIICAICLMAVIYGI